MTCCIVGCELEGGAKDKFIYDHESRQAVTNIGPYLVPMPDLVVVKRQILLSNLSSMSYGGMSNDDGEFDISDDEYRSCLRRNPANQSIIKIAVGGAEFIRGIVRRSLYIDEKLQLSDDQRREFSPVFERVRAYRKASNREATRKLSEVPMLFAERRHSESRKIFVPQVLSERREYLTVGLLAESTLVIAPHMQIVNGDLHEFSILSSKLHHIWVATVCGRLKTDIRYSALLGWNTFPLPALTEKNRGDLTRCAEDILVAREAHFPATIADLYDPDKMPTD